MTGKGEMLNRLALTVGMWLLKGMCIGFGAFVAWRICHALGAM